MAEYMMVLQKKRKTYKVRKDFQEHNYKDMYRFKKENVHWLAQHFLTDSNERRGGAINSVEKMQIFLRYLGSSGFQSGVAKDVGVDQSTVSHALWHVVAAIKSKAENWIKFPRSVAALENAKSEWQRKYMFPDAIGAVDSIHVLVKRPHMNANDFINEHGVASIKVQATCNSREEFTSVDASWPGSVHNSEIWRNSDACKMVTGNHANVLLLGDRKYSISPWLMIPYRNPVTPQQREYNSYISREWLIIQKCFGQLQQRFPFLQSKIKLAPEKVPSLITCCMVLHNVAKYLCDEDYEVPEIQYYNVENEEFDDVIGVLTELGHQRRDEIASKLYGCKN